MYTLVVTLHVLACLALILIVLLQTGRGAEMGAAFGGASQTLFGGSGSSTFLGRLTTGAAVVFMVTCLSLSYLVAAPKSKSIMQDVPIEKPQGPSLPEAKPVQPMPEQGKAGGDAAAKPQDGAAAPAPQAQKQEAAKPSPDAAPKAEGKAPAGAAK